jgi:hypothetical protein
MMVKTKRWPCFHLSHFFIFLMVALPAPAVMAQSTWHVGVRAGYDRVWHETVQDVRAMEGECGAFTSGRGHGVSAALVGEVDLLPWLRGTARLGYAPLGGRLSTYCDNGIIVPTGGDNEFETLLREYTKDVRLDYALLELGFKFMPLELPVFLSCAVSVGLPLFGASWEQEERIVAPEGALFPGFVRSRSNGAGDFTDTQLRTAIVGGIGYAIPLHEGVEFSPELLYSYPFSDATTGYDWKISYASAGASLTWRIEKKEELPPPPEPGAPPPPPPSRPWRVSARRRMRTSTSPRLSSPKPFPFCRMCSSKKIPRGFRASTAQWMSAIRPRLLKPVCREKPWRYTITCSTSSAVGCA